MDRKSETTTRAPMTNSVSPELDSSKPLSNASSTKGSFRRGKFSISPPTQFLPPELESPNGPFEMCNSPGEVGPSPPTSPKPAWDMDTLKQSICSAKTSTGEVRQIIETCTFKPREQAFTTLINMCGQLRDWKKALEVFEAMQSIRGVKSNMYTYSALIAACSSAGEWIKALEIFEQMKDAARLDRNCTPNEFTYSSLITACERGGQFEKALEVYDEMVKNGVNGDHITFSSVLTACEKSKNWERAEILLDEMHKKGLTGNAVIYSELLLHYVERGEWTKALSTCLSMQSSISPQNQQQQDSIQDPMNKKPMISMNPPPPSSSNRVRSRVRQGDSSGTAFILPSPRTTVQSPSGPPSMTPSPKVTPRGVQSSPEGGDQVDVSGGRPPWDMETLKRAICAARTGTGEVHRAFETCTFRPREQAFTSLINMCGRLRDWRKALEVFDAMKLIRGLSPNTYIYSSLIAACSSSGEWEKALGIFEAMKSQAQFDQNCVPNEVTYSALITACQRGGMFDRALELYNEMIQSGVKPDQITYSSVLAACEKSERWDTVEEILDNMHSQGLSGPQGIYTELISHYGDYGAFNKALQVYMTVQMLGVNPDEKLKKALMRVLEKCEKWDLILELFREFQKSGKQVDTEIINLVVQAQDRIQHQQQHHTFSHSNNQQLLMSGNLTLPHPGQIQRRPGLLFGGHSKYPIGGGGSHSSKSVTQGFRVLGFQPPPPPPPTSTAHSQDSHLSIKPKF